MSREELDHSLVSVRVECQGAAAVAGKPPVYRGLWGGVVSRHWTHSGSSGQVQETKDANHIREGREGAQGTREGPKSTDPAMPWAQPQVLREGGQLLLRWYK